MVQIAAYLFRQFPIALACAVLLGMAGTAPAASDDPRPVVVELFTSQGCSSCPPAEAFLAELAAEPGIVALALHVDYWDYIGWKDPFARAHHTARQRAYLDHLGNRYVYTPQMVIDGRKQAVGSRISEVRAAIAAVREEPATVTPRFEMGDTPRAVVPQARYDGTATVWLALYDDRHTTQVARGENAGRTLINKNVVRELTRLGTWDGRARSFPLPVEAARASGRSDCAILVQADETGPILGVATMRLADESG